MGLIFLILLWLVSKLKIRTEFLSKILKNGYSDTDELVFHSIRSEENRIELNVGICQTKKSILWQSLGFFSNKYSNIFFFINNSRPTWENSTNCENAYKLIINFFAKKAVEAKKYYYWSYKKYTKPKYNVNNIIWKND